MPRHQSQGKGRFQYSRPGTKYWEIDGQQQGDRTDPADGLKKALPFIGGGLLLLLLLRKRK